MNNRKRAVGINVRVTDREKQRIVRNARRCKLSTSEYLRQLAEGYTPRELPADRIFETLWQMEELGGKDERLTTLIANLRSAFENGEE